MEFSSTAIGAIVLTSQTNAFCFAPEPVKRIYYNEAAATQQNISLQKVAYVAGYLCFYGSQPGNPQF